MGRPYPTGQAIGQGAPHVGPQQRAAGTYPAVTVITPTTRRKPAVLVVCSLRRTRRGPSTTRHDRRSGESRSGGDGVSNAGSPCFGQELAGEFYFLVGARDRERFFGRLLEVRSDRLDAERRRHAADLGELLGNRVRCHGSHAASSIADAASRFHAPMLTEGCDIYVDGCSGLRKRLPGVPFDGWYPATRDETGTA